MINQNSYNTIHTAWTTQGLGALTPVQWKTHCNFTMGPLCPHLWILYCSMYLLKKKSTFKCISNPCCSRVNCDKSYVNVVSFLNQFLQLCQKCGSGFFISRLDLSSNFLFLWILQWQCPFFSSLFKFLYNLKGYIPFYSYYKILAIFPVLYNTSL